MSPEECCKHGLVREWCGECNPVREVPQEHKPRKKRRRRRTKEEIACDKALEKQEKARAEAWDARFKSGRPPQGFFRQITGRGSWYKEAETAEDRRKELLSTLQPAITWKAKEFKGTRPKHWGAYGFEWGDLISEFWVIANEAVREYLEQEKSGTLPQGLQGLRPEKAVRRIFEYKSRGWYWPKKLDQIVFVGRGLGGEEEWLKEHAELGDKEGLKRLKRLQREIRKIKRGQKRWMIPLDSRWRDLVVPKNVLLRAHFENLTVEAAAWQGYITWEQAELLTKWSSFRTNKELAEEIGISRATLHRRLRPAVEAWMPYAKAAIRFGWRRFFEKGIQFDPRKWKAAGPDEQPEEEIDVDVDAFLYGAADDDMERTNEDE